VNPNREKHEYNTHWSVNPNREERYSIHTGLRIQTGRALFNTHWSVNPNRERHQGMMVGCLAGAFIFHRQIFLRA
jgi:hypothetical protein